MEFTRTDLDSEAIKPEICSIKPVTRGLNADNFPSKRLPYFGIVHRDGKTPSFVFFEVSASFEVPVSASNCAEYHRKWRVGRVQRERSIVCHLILTWFLIDC